MARKDEGIAGSFKTLPMHIFPLKRSMSPLGPTQLMARGKCTEFEGSEPPLASIAIAPLTTMTFKRGPA